MAKTKIEAPKTGARNAFKGGSGIEYLIEPPELLGIERKREFDKLLTEAAFGVGTKGLIAGILQIKEAFNKMQLTDVGHHVTTMLSTASKIHERSEATLRLCTLFMNTKEEDRTEAPTDAQMEEKIADWNAAGIPYNFFVTCAGTFNDTLKALYAAGSPSSPGKAKGKEPKAPSSTTST